MGKHVAQGIDILERMLNDGEREEADAPALV